MYFFLLFLKLFKEIVKKSDITNVKNTKDNIMKSKNKILLSLITLAALFGGCNSSTGNTSPLQTKSALTTLAATQTAAGNNEQNNTEQNLNDFYTPGIDSIVHLVDAEMLQLDADNIQWDLNDSIISYLWTDMDDNILSETNELNRTLYYDPVFDPDDEGMTKYIKTITVATENGNTLSKNYIVYVHKESLSTGQAVLGPIAGAHFTLQKRNSDEIIAEGTTTQGNGVDVMSAGLIPLDNTLLASLEEGYYILSVSGGEDIDREDDGQWDEFVTPNQGTFHAVVTAEELRRGTYHVSVLTEFFYLNLQRLGELQGQTDAQLADNLKEHAKLILKEDVDGDGDIDYADIMRWQPSDDKDKVQELYESLIAKYANLILSGDHADDDSWYTDYAQDDSVNPGLPSLPAGAMLTDPILTNIYDAEGKLIGQISESGAYWVKFYYDEEGYLEKRVYRLGSTTTTTYYDKAGNITSEDVEQTGK